MRLFLMLGRLALAMLIACSPANAPASATPTSASSTAARESGPPSPGTTLGIRDLSVVAAGDVRGDHALVGVFVDSGSNGGGANVLWDVPLDGGPPRSLVAYTRAERPLTGTFSLDLAKRLSPDGRRLVLSDAADVAGRGLVIVDLVTGAARTIVTPDSPDEPVWSLDGQNIAYRGYALQGRLQKESGLWVVEAGRGAPRQVWKSDEPAGAGATLIYGWTEDGSGLVVTRNYQELSVIDVASGAVKRMSAPGNIGRPGEVEVRDTALATGRVVYQHEDVGTVLWAPRWNPTTDEVLFHWVCGAGASCRQELVVVDAVTQARRVLSSAGAIYNASWNGDGTRILYSDVTAVRVMKADGSGGRELFRPARVSSGQQPYVGGIVPFAPR